MEILNIAQQFKGMIISEECQIYNNKTDVSNNVLSVILSENQNPIFYKIEDFRNT